MRTALVTGGSRGIGRAISERLKKAEFHVICPTRAEMDLTNLESVHGYLGKNKDLVVDVLINNAGENTIQSFSEIDPTTWLAIQNTNVNSAFLLTQAFGKKMVAQNYGRILNVGSIFSVVTREGRGSYTTSKAALVGLTKTAAVEWSRFNVLVNAISPGYVDTELTRKNNSPEKIEELCRTIPIGRLARVDELAEVANFLVSDMNTYLTGQNILVDGGFSIQ